MPRLDNVAQTGVLNTCMALRAARRRSKSILKNCFNDLKSSREAKLRRHTGKAERDWD